MIQNMLTYNDTGFNGLAQSDLVCQKIPLNRISQNPTHDLNLMWFERDGRRKQPCHSS